jgi:carbamoyltransferase
MYNLAIYSGHNGSLTIAKDDTILEVLEVERFNNYKNSGLLWYLPPHNPKQLITEILRYFETRYGATEYENLICNQDDTATYTGWFGSVEAFLELYRAKNLIEVKHQEGHAYGAFYQSDLQDATIITFDGGGNDGCFNFYTATRKEGVKFTKMNYDYNIGEKYAEIGKYCSSLKKEDYARMYLVYAGKLMGLCGYGQIREDFIPAMREFYKGHHGTRETRDENYAKFQAAVRLPDVLVGDIELEVAKTSQKVFEDLFYEVSKKEIEESNNKLILSGGCALNILNNTKINDITTTFIPPNPSDCGLSLGFMLSYLKPEKAFDATYMGPEAWDRLQLAEYVERYRADQVNRERLVEDMIIGKIIGVVRGRSELGPRALGNRSILCNPTLPNMKDILNMKVKNREYYRPFAPVVRLEDVNKYFEFDQESRWMSFCPKVREEYRNVLKAVTHVDGTARVQTVTREQNEFLYELLTIMDQKTKVGVLLNTSFNIGGKPILNSYRDATWMLENTQMDGLVLDDYYIIKK